MPSPPRPLRLLDPGRVRIRIAIRTIIAAAAALLITWAISEAADVPGGMVVIATVIAVLVSRSLHATSLPHRLSAVLYVPVIGVLAAFVGRFMLHHPWPGAAIYVAAVWASRYLLRFGGTVRRFGRLALTPLISVLVVPVPPSSAQATGPLWGGAAAVVAVLCVLASQALFPGRPAREAATAADDFRHLADRLRGLAPGSRAHLRTARALHRTALTVEDRLDATRLADRTPLDALSAALLTAEVHLTSPAPAERPTSAERPTPTAVPAPAMPTAPPVAVVPPAPAAAEPPALDAALAELRRAATALRGIRAGERPAEDPPAPARRTGGWRDPQPQARLSLQLAAAMAAAFVAGHLLFHHHWTWTVITAFVVCSAARGRGDVVRRSGLRVAGAFAGAVTGTLVAHLVAGAPAAAITVIFCYLLIGLWLRDVNYAAWAFCVTSLLAVLYTLDGEHGTALLVQRPEGILVGSACGIAAAFFVLPLHTETVMRGRAAHALRLLQDLLSAVREPDPRPTAARRLTRALDRAARDLAEAAAPARAHRALRQGRPKSRGLAAPHADRRAVDRRAANGQATDAQTTDAQVTDAQATALRATDGKAADGAMTEGPCTGGSARPAGHPADWADALAACTHAARALAAADPAELAAARQLLGLTALNIGEVRRRLGHRPDAAPPRPARTGPPHLIRLNTSLAELYDRLPAPATPVTATPSPAPATTG